MVMAIATSACKTELKTAVPRREIMPVDEYHKLRNKPTFVKACPAFHCSIHADEVLALRTLLLPGEGEYYPPSAKELQSGRKKGPSELSIAAVEV